MDIARRTFFGSAGATALAVPAAATAGIGSRSQASIAADEMAYRPGHARFPNVLLTTHDGKRVRFYDDVIRGNKINVINMMYTQCPDICGGTIVNLGRLQQKLADRMGTDVVIWSITLDPRWDTVSVLERYAAVVGAGPFWKFLTGRHVHIERVRRALGFVDRDPVADRDLSTHSGMLRVGNDYMSRWMAARGMTPVDQLAQEVLWIGRAHPS